MEQDVPFLSLVLGVVDSAVGLDTLLPNESRQGFPLVNPNHLQGIKPTIAKIMGQGGSKAVVVHNLRILDVEEIKSVPYVPLSIPSSND
ncbi:hypothetical protein [endosymbiont of Lamellibrachia barhami]|uniref:hypothetical protein n=1 Tax=endosymbiont of Lamellibrachia barhami TaxID=205975 RepID=UPI0015B2AB82|nr:hypothetical protein [endosymbiont of Lamellibrachia barhami]